MQGIAAESLNAIGALTLVGFILKWAIGSFIKQVEQAFARSEALQTRLDQLMEETIKRNTQAMERMAQAVETLTKKEGKGR